MKACRIQVAMMSAHRIGSNAWTGAHPVTAGQGAKGMAIAEMMNEIDGAAHTDDQLVTKTGPCSRAI